MTTARPTTYWKYIRVPELLDLQGGLEDQEGELDNEEVLFITVHQVFELWFKLMLRELRKARDLFGSGVVEEQQLAGAASRLARISTIFRVATKHFEVVETLGTREYLEFRNKLMPASGGQSVQMRQIEILFGLSDEDRVPLGSEGGHMQVLREADGSFGEAHAAVEQAMADRPNLKEAVDAWLLRTPIDGVPHDAPEADASLDAFIERFLEAHGREVDASCAHALEISGDEDAREQLLKRYEWEKSSAAAFLRPTPEEGGRERACTRAAMIFIETYRELPLLAWPREVLAALLEVEQLFLVFRQRHARMVERVIGRRTGTGGSLGVAYLDETALRYRIFGDLWAVRTLMVRPGATPSLEHADYYGFSSQH
jgi:tryptophan 2,3-dioxygenase